MRPEFQRDKDTLTMAMNFHIAAAQRTYIERIDITGNRQTQDKVIRREFRVAEGDAFNSFLAQALAGPHQFARLSSRTSSRSSDVKGSAPDRIVLEANVEEKSNGELSLSAGFSSLEQFILQASIRQRNFRGKGQELSRLRRLFELFEVGRAGLHRTLSVRQEHRASAATIFRRDYNAFNYIGDDRQTTYSQVSTGFQVVAGVPLTEYWSLSGRYGLAL